MSSFFQSPLIPNQPNPVPPWFAPIGNQMAQNYFQQYNNPWGMTNQASGPSQLNPYGGRGMFNPYQGGYGQQMGGYGQMGGGYGGYGGGMGGGGGSMGNMGSGGPPWMGGNQVTPPGGGYYGQYGGGTGPTPVGGGQGGVVDPRSALGGGGYGSYPRGGGYGGGSMGNMWGGQPGWWGQSPYGGGGRTQNMGMRTPVGGDTGTGTPAPMGTADDPYGRGQRNLGTDSPAPPEPPPTDAIPPPAPPDRGAISRTPGRRRGTMPMYDGQIQGGGRGNPAQLMQLMMALKAAGGGGMQGGPPQGGMPMGR